MKHELMDELVACLREHASFLHRGNEKRMVLKAADLLIAKDAEIAALREAARMAYDWITEHGEIVFSCGGMQAIDPMNAVALALRQAMAQAVQPG